MVDDGVEERLEVFAGNCQIEGCGAELAVGVDNGEVELIFSCVEIDEEVIDFVQDFFGAGVGTVDLVYDENGRELRFKGLVKDVAGLRQRAFRGVDEQDDAVHPF